ncbi:MAG: hypothetical protein WCZ86_10325 [Desulfurivibrionaceae bacterium]|jgi:hypothetical protein
MSCKHLLHYSHGANIWSVSSCSAKNTPYVPSLHELERYCQSGNHIVCPAYLFSFGGGGMATELPVPAGITRIQLSRQKSA